MIDTKDKRVVRKWKNKRRADYLKRLVVRICTIVTTFAAIISPFLVWMTLQEMEKERDFSHKPDIVFCQEAHREAIKVGVAIEKGGEIGILGVPYDECSPNGTQKLHLINIGVGVAKNVQVHFNVSDVQACIKWLEKKHCVNDIRSTSYYGELWYTRKQIEKKEDVKELYYLSEDNIQIEQYIAPITEVRDQVIYVSLPEIYRILLPRMYNIPDIETKDFPMLRINLSWEDVQGKQYKRTLKIVSDFFNPPKNSEEISDLKKSDENVIYIPMFVRLYEIR